jgi:hypothetical protein
VASSLSVHAYDGPLGGPLVYRHHAFWRWRTATQQRSSRAQAARGIYREFLSISIQWPELRTADYCVLGDLAQRAAYESYVDYLLYTAEQVLELDPEDWESAIAARLLGHQPYLCTFQAADLATLTPAVAQLVRRLATDCGEMALCTAGQP